MKFPSKKLITKFLIELMAEILLSFLGLDDVANYSEFIFERPKYLSKIICTFHFSLTPNTKHLIPISTIQLILHDYLYQYR